MPHQTLVMPRTPARTRRLVLLAVALVVALVAFSFHMLDAVAWSVAHHSTGGTAEGTAVHVPIPWTPRGKPNRPSQIRLLRAPWGLGEPQEWAVLETNTPRLSTDSFHKGLERMTSQFASGSSALSPYPLPPDLQGRFVCTETHVPKFLTWQLSCVSTDGFWSVNLFAPTPRERDLLPVLRGLRTP